uniref:Uncharacterized protein n=1 Tax=Anguilla anguilla TaxID=7936 RepID=A0A0E9U2Y6_ANGAN
MFFIVHAAKVQRLSDRRSVSQSVSQSHSLKRFPSQLSLGFNS